MDPDTGQLRHDFTDPTWDTRFLGDLYQDLSEHAKKTYALLQTPRFVEAFILDRTLDPAIATFGLAETTIIDPTCGSGHFLLGAFERLFHRWSEAEPATNRRELAKRALSAIGGIDLNPFAASIARFRLLLAALRAGGDSSLAHAPAYEIHIAVGDSLLHGDPPGRLPGMHTPDEEEALVAAHGYEAEDVEAVRKLLRRGWHAVVGNPPYVTVKDPAMNAAYRARFDTCHRQYSLGVPFTERFWQLARHEGGQPERVGYVGMITANSFMKREFGKLLIEKWFPANDVTHVVDTSGAYIPGHGTPTVILLGRNRSPVASTVRAVMGIRGEPSTAGEPGEGPGVVEHRRPRRRAGQPERLRQRRGPRPSPPGNPSVEHRRRRRRRAEGSSRPVGRPLATSSSISATQVRPTPTMLSSHPHSAQARFGGRLDLARMVVIGEVLRDYAMDEADWSFFPYENEAIVSMPLKSPPGCGDCGHAGRRCGRRQPSRAHASNEGRPWWEYIMLSHCIGCGRRCRSRLRRWRRTTTSCWIGAGRCSTARRR